MVEVEFVLLLRLHNCKILQMLQKLSHLSITFSKKPVSTRVGSLNSQINTLKYIHNVLIYYNFIGLSDDNRYRLFLKHVLYYKITYLNNITCFLFPVMWIAMHLQLLQIIILREALQLPVYQHGKLKFLPKIIILNISFYTRFV